MARIRTIKPEFVESESIGKLSREARLLFILLWTIVDDDGRARASSRFLASRLFPYDDDAMKKIGGWLSELQAGQHVRLYEADGDSYLDIPKWRTHQKIDHPAKSRLPEFREPLANVSDILARTGETIAPHTLDLGPSTKDLGPRTVEGDGAVAPALPLDAAVQAFNATAGPAGWAQVQRLTSSRRASLTLRIEEAGGLEGWQCAMAKAAASRFLTGKIPRGEKHRNWRPDFDWFVTAANFTKLMEGSYDDATGTAVGGLAADVARAADLLRDREYRGI